MLDDEEHPSQRPVSQGGNQTKEADELVSEKEEQYPHGTRLVLIVIALALSVFLSALDIVSLHVGWVGACDTWLNIEILLMRSS
jgi:hypothetical protein